MKTFADYLVEADSEYVIRVLSPADIHSEPTLGKIRTALARHDLRDLKVGSLKPFRPNPPEFPNETFVQVYTLEAVLGTIPPRENAGQSLAAEIAAETRIPDRLIKVEIDGQDDKDFDSSDEKPLTSTEVGEHPADKRAMSDDPQSLVGSVRARAAVEEIAGREASRRKGKETPTFIADHLGLMQFFAESRVRGYYQCRLNESGSVVVESGPHRERPPGRYVATRADAASLSSK